MRLVVINHLTLDGTMQGPGRPDEDTRNGFSHGGWAIPGGDEVMGGVLGARMGRPDGGLLLGRWSYEEMLASWNAQGGPYKEALNAAPKYAVSGNPATRLEWPNSLLFIHPLVLGSGRRLFEHEDHPIKLRLVESTATTTGVIIATYHPER